MCLIHLSRKILLLLNCENRRQLSSCVLYACIMSSVINCWNGFIPEKHWFWDPLKLSFVWGEGKGSNHLSSLQFLEASFTSTFRYILLRPIFLWKSCLATTFSCKPILFLSLSRRSISLRYVFICLFFQFVDRSLFSLPYPAENSLSLYSLPLSFFHAHFYWWVLSEPRPMH